MPTDSLELIKADRSRARPASPSAEQRLAQRADQPGGASRVRSVDALRGLVMALMLLDHLRETWFLHVAVADPVDARTVLPALFVARLLVSLCAPVFVALTGLAAYLYGRRHTLGETSAYLVKRGLVLMAIEVLFLSPIYWTAMPPTFWLQVIWCIGVCMIALAALIHLPRRVLIGLGLVIVGGHDLLDGIRLAPGDPFYVPWAMLHQRAVIDLPFGAIAKTTYPVLAWVGVIILGYAIGPWFGQDVAPSARRSRLIGSGLAMLALFVGVRAANVYGDAGWFVVTGDPARTAMSILSLTKYPPSLLFLLLTLGIGALLLALFERGAGSGAIAALAVFGGAPMFFYLFHLSVLRLLYNGALAIWRPTKGSVFGLDDYGWVLVWYGVLIVPLLLATAWFARLKRRRRDLTWLSYL